MTEEIDDLEFFQQDFTTASNWEIFTARLEEIFHEWKLPFVCLGEKLSRNQLSLCDWTTCQEIINFADVEMKIVRFTAKLGDSGKNDSVGKDEGSRQCQAFMDLMSLDNDYSILDEEVEGSMHPIARWYGLRDFVVVVSTKQPIYNESQIRILLSSVHIAVAESNCEVPVFIEVIDKSQTYPIFLGVCEFQSTRLSFDVVHLQTTPPQFKYLSGLLDMFKGKIGVQYEDPVSVSVRLSYRLNQFGSATRFGKWSNSFATNPFDFPEDDEQAPKDDQEPFTVLPFGAMCDPVDELVIYCTWPNVADNVVIDSQTYSDFDPLLAPKWSLRARYQPLPACFLSEVLKEYLHNLEVMTTLSELLGDSITSTGAAFGVNPLDVLTESKIPSLSSVLPTLSRRRKDNQKSSGPIRDDLLMKMLYYLFPDAQENSQHPYNIPEIEPYDPLKIKSAPPDSLVHRLSALLALCQEYFGGKKAVAHLWMEFAQEMRYRVERCIPIPG
uniref:Uncharacterized protein n=1 Tax=Phlebotomus papatasi TaxID=29031 RepID=A0A1B0DRF3_PHLPP